MVGIQEGMPTPGGPEKETPVMPRVKELSTGYLITVVFLKEALNSDTSWLVTLLANRNHFSCSNYLLPSERPLACW